MLSDDNVTERLAEAVPELLPLINAELADWGVGKPGPHVIFGTLVNPVLLGLLDEGERKEIENLQDIYGIAAEPIVELVDGPARARITFLERVFDFIEQMARSEDIRVQDVVGATICERLESHPIALAEARKYLGPDTARQVY